MPTTLHLRALALIFTLLHTLPATTAIPFTSTALSPSLYLFPAALPAAPTPPTKSPEPSTRLALSSATGALLPRTDALSPLTPRSGPIIWCATQSSTYFSLSTSGSSSSTSTLAVALTLAYLSIGSAHPSPPSSDYFVPGTGVSLTTEWAFQVLNADNHQLTRGILAAALGALADYVVTHGVGLEVFEVFDGGNMVGRGTVGVGNGVALGLDEVALG